MAPRQIDVWLAEIDPLAPGVSFLVTPSNGELAGDTTPQTTRAFVAYVGAQLGVNGSFFSSAGKRQLDVLGLSVSQGDAYSPFARGFTDAINFSPDNVATIIRGVGKASQKVSSKARSPGRPSERPRPKGEGIAAPSPNPLPKGEGFKAPSPKTLAKKPGAKAKKAIAPPVSLGFAHEPDVPLYNALGGKNRLVKDGKNVAGVDPAIHPRTAVGIKSDGKVLLLTVDGREPGHSMGLTLRELANVMIASGARDALNLDGGGSTTFVMDDPCTPANDPKVMNLSCDLYPSKQHGKERPVGNNIAVFAQKRTEPVENEYAGGQMGAKECTAANSKAACCSYRGRSRGCCRRMLFLPGFRIGRGS